MTVIWLDGDGSELDRRTYAQGEAEPVTDKIPVKAEDADYSYTFVRWDDGRIDGSTKIYWPVFTRKSKIRPVLIGNIPKATYPPSVVEMQHCLVTIDPKTPGKGDNVTITVVPDAGYQVDSVVVQDPDGREIALRKTGNGTYSFVQPDTKVSISAVCKATEPAPKQTFTDVGEDDWFRDAVYFCRDNGYFRGIDDTHFMPDGTMTRAMFVTVLYRMAGEPKVTGPNQFGDVESGEWYTDAVIWAAEQGLVDGYDNGLFGATDSVTREQMVTLLWRFSGKAADESTDLSKFSDADRISDWAKDAFEWAIGIGLIRGKGSGVLDPGGTATRAEVAQIAMNYSIRVG
jgi:hypothetical protein